MQMDASWGSGCSVKIIIMMTQRRMQPKRVLNSLTLTASSYVHLIRPLWFLFLQTFLFFFPSPSSLKVAHRPVCVCVCVCGRWGGVAMKTPPSSGREGEERKGEERGGGGEMLASAPRTAPGAAAAVSGSVLGPLRCSEHTKQGGKSKLWFLWLFLLSSLLTALEVLRPDQAPDRTITGLPRFFLFVFCFAWTIPAQVSRPWHAPSPRLQPSPRLPPNQHRPENQLLLEGKLRRKQKWHQLLRLFGPKPEISYWTFSFFFFSFFFSFFFFWFLLRNFLDFYLLDHHKFLVQSVSQASSSSHWVLLSLSRRFITHTGTAIFLLRHCRVVTAMGGWKLLRQTALRWSWRPRVRTENPGTRLSNFHRWSSSFSSFLSSPAWVQVCVARVQLFHDGNDGAEWEL